MSASRRLDIDFAAMRTPVLAAEPLSDQPATGVGLLDVPEVAMGQLVAVSITMPGETSLVALLTAEQSRALRARLVELEPHIGTQGRA